MVYLRYILRYRKQDCDGCTMHTIDKRGGKWHQRLLSVRGDPTLESDSVKLVRSGMKAGPGLACRPVDR